MPEIRSFVSVLRSPVPPFDRSDEECELFRRVQRVYVQRKCELSAIQEGSPRKRCKFLASKSAKLFANTKVHILARKSAKLIANFSAIKVTSLPSHSLYLSLSHRAHLTHNTGSASTLPRITAVEQCCNVIKLVLKFETGRSTTKKLPGQARLLHKRHDRHKFYWFRRSGKCEDKRSLTKRPKGKDLRELSQLLGGKLRSGACCCSGSIPGWGLCGTFRFCQTFTSHCSCPFLFHFAFPFQLLFKIMYCNNYILVRCPMMITCIDLHQLVMNFNEGRSLVRGNGYDASSQ